jgi:ArsR family transcriptional regulator, virulence genes transcriptional regulator
MPDPSAMVESASEASAFLKALANPKRLLILCHLGQGEMSVSDLEAALRLRQPTLSQQLARLREDDLVATRRNGKMVYYRVSSDEVRRMIELLYELFCAEGARARHRSVQTGDQAGQAKMTPR